jgi:hypothetical protein
MTPIRIGGSCACTHPVAQMAKARTDFLNMFPPKDNVFVSFVVFVISTDRSATAR